MRLQPHRQAGGERGDTVTREEMLDAAGLAGKAGVGKTPLEQVGAAIMVTIWTVGAEIVETLRDVEKAVMSFERTYDERTR